MSVKLVEDCAPGISHSKEKFVATPKKPKSSKPKSSKPKSSKPKSSKTSNQKEQKKSVMSVFGPPYIVILVVAVILTIVLVFYVFPQFKEWLGHTRIKGGETAQGPKPTGEQIPDCLPVYFYDSTSQYLVPVHMPLRDDSMFTDVKARRIVERLIGGPPNDALQGVMPKGTRINDVKFDMDMVTVDLSEDLVSYGGGSALEQGIVDSLLYSLTELKDVKQVQIKIGGKKRDYLPEGTPIDQPLERDKGPNSNRSMPEGQPSGYIYFLERSGQFLVPVLMSWEGNENDAMAKLTVLYSPPPEPMSDSLVSPAPEGMRILKCEIKDGKLTLVLDHDNFANVFKEFNARDFLEATYLTLDDLESFRDKDITVGTGQEAVELWKYSAFEKLEKMQIPPTCFNVVKE